MIKDSSVNKDSGVANNVYVCDWCGFEFSQTVRKVKKVSSQVVCPRCKTFIKTW